MLTEGPPTHSLPPLRVQTSIVKGDPNIAALQQRRERQLQGESAVLSPSSARDRAPAGTLASAPQTPSSQRDDLVGDILSDYSVAAPAPASEPAPTPSKPPKPAGTSTLGQLAAAMGIEMKGAAPAARSVDEDEMMEANELDTSAFLKHHADPPLTKPGLAAVALGKMFAPR